MSVNEFTKQDPPQNLDNNAQKNFIKYFKQLGEKPKTTVRFFDRTNFYSVYGPDDTETIAKLIYKSTAFIRTMKPNEEVSLSYVTLSKSNFETSVRELLLVRNYRVEVYVKSGLNDWKVEYRGSPGNLLQFEDIIFNNKEVLVGNLILSLQVRLDGGAQRKLGVATIDQNECKIQVLEFVDDDFYTELEATIVLLSPKECLLPSADGQYADIKTLLERNGVMITITKKTPSSEKTELLQDLNRLLRFAKDQQENANGRSELEMKLAMEALRVGIRYLDLTNDRSNFGQFEMNQLDLKRFVHLDAAAVTALNILPKPGSQYTSPAYRYESILGVLDRCLTPQGHRLMAQWVKQPLRSYEILNDRHNIVECLLDSPTTLSTLHEDLLKRLPDVLMLTKRLMRRKATLQDLFRVFQVIMRTPKIVNILVELENLTVNNVICDQLKSILEDLNGLRNMVQQIIDFEAISSGEYLIAASFDDNLQEMKRSMDRIYAKMESLREKTAEDLELDKPQSVRLENVSHLGYHFRITLKDDANLRKRKNYKILDAIKGGVRFTSEKLSEYSEDFCNIRSQYEEQQSTIVQEVIKIAIGYIAPLTLLNNAIAQIDCLVSFAIAAQSAPIPYVRPKMFKEGHGVLHLKDIRHPCLELQEAVTFIPNSLDFKKDECNMYIITGPNMGGKSTYIRSVGTAVLMAQVGSFVPCSEATISMVDSILGRIGASDNIIKGLSTFMVEMIETSGIVRTATDRSLVIIDELGRGTSTYEGCGIAWSIAEYLAKDIKCFTLFATHFHEITSLSDTVNTVKNVHMAAVTDNENFTLLYQVLPGAIEKSFGIQVARLADFPEHVVQRAEEVYNEFEDQHVDKQTAEDKKMMAKINKAIVELSTGNNADIDENELTKLVEEFAKEIKALDSDYFKAIQASMKE